MRSIRSIRTIGLLSGAVALAALASPVAAAAPVTSTWSDSYTVSHDCGIVESTTSTITEKAFFENGAWVRSLLTFRFDGVYTGPTGATYASTSHQVGTFTPTTGTVSGQGTFLRGAGGVLVMDAGNIVFDLGTGETLRASAQVIRYDDPDASTAFEAALCERLG